MSLLEVVVTIGNRCLADELQELGHKRTYALRWNDKRRDPNIKLHNSIEVYDGIINVDFPAKKFGTKKGYSMRLFGNVLDIALHVVNIFAA
eukprot:1697609-Amphidinium_carterae.1